MNLFKKFLYISIFFFLSINLSHSKEKLAFINLDKILNTSNPGKVVLNDIKMINEKNVADLKKMESELKKNENDLNNKKNIISNEEFQKELTLLREKIKKFNNLKDKMVTSYEEQRLKKLNNFFITINPIIQKYMNDNSINMLLEQKNVFIGKTSSDITDKIIVEINKSSK